MKTKRVLIEFRTTVVVDVSDVRPEPHKLRNACEYAKNFVGLSGVIYGNHEVGQADGSVVRSLVIVDTDTRITESFESSDEN